MMRALDLVHRWTGGLIGLLLAALGLSGTLLLHKEEWLRLMLPHAGDAQVNGTVALGAVAQRWFDGVEPPGSILFSSERFGLHRLNYADGSGAYVSQSGEVVERWNSVWERPELWLFDFHHYLFAGETGALVAGIAGLIGLGFVITGVILWWRTRRTFELRLIPKRMSRPSIVRHHRDLGTVMGPLLFLSMLTGVMMVLRPVAELVLRPFSPPDEISRSLAPPEAKGGAPGKLDYTALIAAARERYPDAEVRIIARPRAPDGLVSMRLRQQAEWLPNGRTTFWFDPADGRIVEARDALAMPRGAQLFNMAYPVHAGKVGGLAYRVVLTLSGLTLTMLGSFAVWTFWTERGRRWRNRPRPRLSTAGAPAE